MPDTHPDPTRLGREFILLLIAFSLHILAAVLAIVGVIAEPANWGGFLPMAVSTWGVYHVLGKFMDHRNRLKMSSLKPPA